MQDSLEERYKKELPNDSEPIISILYAIVGVGAQEVRKYMSDEMEWKQQILLGWELTSQTRKVDQIDTPLTVHHRYNRSVSEKSTLRKLLQGYTGKKYFEGKTMIDYNDFIGTMGVLQIENITANNGKQYTNVLSWTQAMKSMQMPKSGFHAPFMFDISALKPTWQQYLLMPIWMQKLVNKSSDFMMHMKHKAVPNEIMFHIEKEHASGAQSANHTPPADPVFQNQGQRQSLSDDELFKL